MGGQIIRYGKVMASAKRPVHRLEVDRLARDVKTLVGQVKDLTHRVRQLERAGYCGYPGGD